MIIAIIVLVFLVVQFAAMGWIGGLGPMRFLAAVRMGRLPGNAREYHLENVQPHNESLLRGKTICFLGSSVTFGAASLGVSMADYIGVLDSCTIIKEAVSGTTMAGTNASAYVGRLLANVNANANIDIFICQLSTNDASKELPLGEVSSGTELKDFNRETVIGAMEYIIAYVRITWNCDIVFYTGTRYESEAYAAMVDALLAFRDKWGIGVIDLWNDTEMNTVSEDDYVLYMNDKVHPTQAGYLKWWVPKIQKVLYELSAG